MTAQGALVIWDYLGRRVRSYDVMTTLQKRTSEAEGPDILKLVFKRNDNTRAQASFWEQWGCLPLFGFSELDDHAKLYVPDHVGLPSIEILDGIDTRF